MTTIVNANAAPDFAAFFLTDTSRLEIELPNGDPMLYNGQQVVAVLHGPATDVYVKAKDAMEKEATRRVFAAMGAKKKKGEDEDKEADPKFLTAVTAEFENFPYPGGPGAIYRERRLQYITDQVRRHLNDLGNFFKGQSKT
ncbi:MAG: hypothetical protein Q8N13_10545 [Acidovorax sp.]|nr:hypothetical protein [Acidovorax sp.]